MAISLFFVPEGGSSIRQKELVYAECKAHVAKIAHKRRRNTKPAAGTHMKSLVDQGQEQTGRKRHYHDQHCDKDYTSQKLNEVNDNTLSLQCLPTRAYERPISFPRINDPLGCPLTATSAQVMQAIRFAQFHLVKSCSPPFMQRMTGTQADPTSLEKATKLRMTEWMWTLWASNTGLFWAVLASVVPLMVPHTSGDERLKLRYMVMQLKARSLTNLRCLIYQLADPNNSNPLATVYHVKALFREACASGDLIAARRHARIVEKVAGMLTQEEAGLQCSRLALWSDALPALLQMRRPIVQYSAWMTPVIEKIWRDAENIIPDAQYGSSRVQCYIRDQTIRKAFRHLQKSLQVINSDWLASEDPGQDRRVELMFRWMTTKAEHHICRLLNICVDKIESRPDQETKPGTPFIEQHMELAFSLALLYLYQKCFFIMETSNGIDIHESAHVIYPYLRSATQRAQSHCSEIEQDFNKDAFFWLAFIGSEMERNMIDVRDGSVQFHLNGSCLKQVPSWFLPQVVTYGIDLGLQSWTDARNVIVDFAWDDICHPEVGDWYERLFLS